MADVVPLAEVREQPLTLALWTAGVIDRWRMIGASTLGVLALALLAAVVLPPVYSVTVSFAPNPSSSSKLGSALSGSLGALSGLAGSIGGGSLGGEPSESPAFYAELLQSRELLTRLLLTRFRDPRDGAHADSARLVDIMKLRSDDPKRRIELGVKALTKAIKTEADPRTNLVKVTVTDRYPELAAREANIALALVNTFNLEQRASRARGKRQYLQTRMADARNELAVAQARYRDFLAGNRQWTSSPTLASQEATLRRDQEVATDLYLTVERQYESARLDEFNDAALITVVDSAVAPVKPTWPRYSLLIPGALLLGLFVGVMLAGIATVYADWSAREPAAAHELAAALLRRRARPNVPPVARRA
jgi:uncharacterized protein involved in exopolysaccharide biosynthesis